MQNYRKSASNDEQYPKKSLSNSKIFIHHRRKAIIIASILLIIVAFDLSPFGGNVRFYSKWIECGRKPVATDISLGFGASVPSYTEPNAVNVFRFGQPSYFCTPLAAEDAGYSANSQSYEYRYKNLDNSGRDRRLNPKK